MLCTIYILRNKINDKVYVGQTWRSLSERFKHGRGYDPCLHLSRAIKTHGIENFYYETMTFCSTQETADYWESYFISKLDSCNIDKGYNLRSGGARGLQSEESKRKISAYQKGKIVSDSTRELLSKILLDNPIRMMGEENPMYGKAGSEHPMFGKHHSDETRKKMSAAKKGKPSSNKGKKMSDAARLKMSKAKKKNANGTFS